MPFGWPSVCDLVVVAVDGSGGKRDSDCASWAMSVRALSHTGIWHFCGMRTRLVTICIDDVEFIGASVADSNSAELSAQIWAI